MIDISNRRECFFDTFLVNKQRTTAEFMLHHPQKKEVCIVHDEPWERYNTDYHNFFFDDGIYRMYYRNTTPKGYGVLCYAESTDGIHWTKPALHIREYDGNDNNNIIMDKWDFFEDSVDNCMVFKDTNPECPTDKKYKAVAGITIDKVVGLHWYYSSDAIHFSYGGLITTNGQFDSLNIMFFDENKSIYRCYFRDFHDPYTFEQAQWGEDAVRDIRYMESADFLTWSEPRLLNFNDAEDTPLYTSMAQNYYRADHMIIGFPTRYLYRREWTANYDELCGKEARLKRMEKVHRTGMVVTDGLFMASHDGYNFKKYDEAFFRPGPENPYNWVYGSGYCARGMVETPSDTPGAEPEISMFYWDKHMSEENNELVRYTIRRDGFVSLHSGATEKMLVTKKFIYDGNDLFINFSTSASGYMYFTLVSEDNERFESCEIFGDKTDRKVTFGNDAVKKLSGKPVVMEVRMRDADLYSVKFD